MIKYFSAIAVAIAVALSGCSSDGSDDPPSSTAGTGTTGTGTAGTATAGTGTTGTGTTGTGTAGTGTTGTGTTGTGTTGTTAGAVDGGTITPSGDIVGVWFGANNFGEGVMVIDANQNVTAFAENGVGQYQTVFGPASSNLQFFSHRNSENTAFADSFTLAGDPADAATNIAYNLSVSNDGQQIDNNGAGGNFSMAFANQNDLAPISLESIAGDWTAKTSFCPTDCNITLQMTFTAEGGVSGSTQFNDTAPLPLSGTVEVAAGASQYLNVSFLWTEKSRTGVVHLDRRDPTRLMINTVGPEEEGESRSFTASMIRR